MTEGLIDIRTNLVEFPWTDLDSAKVADLERVGIVPAQLAGDVPVVMVVIRDLSGERYVVVVPLSTAVEAIGLLMPGAVSMLDGGR